MNRQHFTDGGGYILVEAEIDASQVHGTGDCLYPRLIIPVKLNFSALKNRGADFVFKDVSARLRSQHTILADSLPHPLEIVQRSNYSIFQERSVFLEFPLDSRRIAKLEAQRDGKDLAIGLDIMINSEEHGVIGFGEEAKRQSVWGLRWVRPLRASMEFIIPGSLWIKSVLAQTGHGIIHVVELPAVPVAACQTLQHSYDALVQAQSRHALGLYDDAVAKCRIALDRFFEHVPVDPKHKDSRRIPVLKKVWQAKLGEATYDWLNRTLGAIKDAANPTAHSPNPHFDQFESQMLMAITTTLIAYAARTEEVEKEKL